MRYDNLSTVTNVQEIRIGEDDARSNGSRLEALTGSRTGSHARQIMRMLAVVAVCAVALPVALAGLHRVRGVARPSRSMNKEVVEDFSLPKPDFNPLFNFTSSQLQRLEHLADSEHFNFTNPFNFTKPSELTPPQMQKLKDLGIFLPSFVDIQHEYYDSGKVVMGSWHWPSCDRDHMEKCSVMDVHGCCCKPGFAYVAGNAGFPIAKGAAAGAAVGGLVTGALLGSDVGASTASGAASGAVGGAVQYLLESGECDPKEQLSKSVQSHLS
jgi:hypothetical protein